MSKLYSEQHRSLQDEFETRALADTLEKLIVHSEITAEEKAFIETREMFFLSTVDHLGRPSVSYKGGEKGFIKVVDKSTLAFPSYDGNGMYLSAGNITANNKVGLLLIDFENPHRIRIQGEATVDLNDPLLTEYKEAQLIIRITIKEMWMNCPRYIHKHQKIESSKYVPQKSCETPLPEWKKLDLLQSILPSKDKGKAEKQGGTISVKELQKYERRDDT
jgi:predicted pyridoxine 5'-phosphate oxidase superfamily flavin-nucleotide-binding protein